LIIALVGMFKTTRENRWLWGGVVVFFALVSLGPHLNISRWIYLPKPWNPCYLLVYYLPAGSMILEPFRYVLVACFGLAMLTAIGMNSIVSLYRKLALALIVVLDIASGTSVGFPLPALKYQENTQMKRLAELPPGGIVHLPFFIQGTALFDREHFAYQLIHDHPIGDGIMGFPPDVYLQNPLLCQILQREQTSFEMFLFPCENTDLSSSADELKGMNFQAIVVEHNKYEDVIWLEISKLLDRSFPVKESDDNLTIYRLGSP